MTSRLYKGARRAPFWKKGGRRAPWYLRHLAKSAISAPTFSIGPPNGPLYRLYSQKCNFCTHFTVGPPNGPLYRMNIEKCNFCTHFTVGPPNGPLYRMNGKKCNFCTQRTPQHCTTTPEKGTETQGYYSWQTTPRESGSKKNYSSSRNMQGGKA